MGPPVVSPLILLPLIFLLNPSSAVDTDPSFQYNCVSNENFIANSTYGASLHLLLTQLSEEADFKNGFSNISVGQSPDKVNAVGICRGDQKEDACRICLNQTISEVQQRCSDHKEAIGWSDFCMVRYSSHEIVGIVETYPSDVLYSGNALDFDSFNHVLSSLLNNLTSRAAAGGSFRKFAADNTKGTDSFPRIYALEQCTPDLSQQDCSFCLATAIGRIESSCYGRTGCRVVQPSCSVRYETNPFFAAVDVIPQQSLPPLVEGNDNNTTYIVSASIAGILLVAVCIFIWIFTRSTNIGRSIVVALSEMHTGEPLQFDYQKIREAANDFSDKNKLGEGGFGAVYKGKLPNGEEIAIKRLFNRSGRVDMEFMDKVHLVAKLQHRNLVKLFGFCSKENERLLIFEFVPNGSLNDFLFDPSKREQLDWGKRRGIIIGVASGLLYLHKHSHIRTVHRDLKASNILLDKDMNPKIADFGSAKLFKGDESQGNSNRVVGTYGYIAPEYAMSGHISLKSDVFSFGVLMLEIIRGEKTSFYSNGKSKLLSIAWENWRNKTISEFIDPTLRNNPRTDEIVRYIHIGLLCVQDFEVRPKMDSVMNDLNCSSLTSLQEPKPPALLVNQRGHHQTDAIDIYRTGGYQGIHRTA